MCLPKVTAAAAAMDPTPPRSPARPALPLRGREGSKTIILTKFEKAAERTETDLSRVEVSHLFNLQLVSALLTRPDG